MMNEFKYVRLADVGAHLAEGWLMADDFAGLHHGTYAVLMGRHNADVCHDAPTASAEVITNEAKDARRDT